MIIISTLTLFFCDINGTIEGSSTNKISDYKKFNDIIKEIQQKNNSDYIIFSLISSDSSSFVKNKTNFINSFNKNFIIFGKQFFDNGYIDENKIITGISGKAQQIIYYINELSKIYKIDSVIYADDCIIYHDILHELAKNYNLDDIITSIIPTKGKGLSELNELLENYINSTKEKQKVIQINYE